MVSQISHLSLKMQLEVYDASSYCKGIFFFLMEELMPCFCTFSLILIAVAGGTLYCGSQGNRCPFSLSLLSVFIWVGELSKGFLVNKVDC